MTLQHEILSFLYWLFFSMYIFDGMSKGSSQERFFASTLCAVFFAAPVPAAVSLDISFRIFNADDDDCDELAVPL